MDVAEVRYSTLSKLENLSFSVWKKVVRVMVNHHIEDVGKAKIVAGLSREG